MNLDVDADELPSSRQEVPEGVLLARWLSDSIGNHQMRQATALLGSYQDGYWLRRFVNEPALREVIQPQAPEAHYLTRSDRYLLPPSRINGPAAPAAVHWGRIAELLEVEGALDDDRLEPGTMGPHLAALEIAVSLSAGRPVNLLYAVRVLPAADWRDIVTRIATAADFV
ncbi:hypothetical protein ACWCPT_29410 [Streptomyces sp. NPDC002308]